MKDPRYYASRAFAKYDPLRLAGFAENIATKTKDLAPFTDPEPPLDSITTAATDLRTKEEATYTGGRPETMSRDEAFDVLEGLLREFAAYVEDKAKNNPDLIMATGLEVTTASHSTVPIVPTSILEASNVSEGKLGFKLLSCGARSYEMWGRTGTADFQHFITVTDPRYFEVSGLVPGALYDWKARALYGNNQYSDWSDVVSHRST